MKNRGQVASNLTKLLCPIFGLFFVVLGWACAADSYHIRYVVEPKPPIGTSAAVTKVTINVSGNYPSHELRFQMPVWSPGDYWVQDHAKYVTDVSAHKDLEDNRPSAALPVGHPDANTWTVSPPTNGSFSLTYSLPNTPTGHFSENVVVKENYAFYNGPATYMYLAGQKHEPVTLTVISPEGWKPGFASLGLAKQQSANKASVTFDADDFDTLADSPLVTGLYEIREFETAGRKHSLVFMNNISGVQFDNFPPVFKKIVDEECRLMGGAPYRQYAFFLDVGGRGGSLEHLNSCRLGWYKGSRAEYAAGLIAHEFFHLWNVKRIRPKVLGPFNYVVPPITKNLWFCEGVTDYYSMLVPMRSGLASESQALRQFGGTIGALQSNPNRLRVNLEECSARVWEAGNSSGFGGYSYYLKGSLVGLCLDLKLRHESKGKVSLDDVMRYMMSRYGLPKAGFEEDGIREAVVKFGVDGMAPFYDSLCRSTEEMPFAECLGFVGLELGKSGELINKPDVSAQELALRAHWLSGR